MVVSYPAATTEACRLALDYLRRQEWIHLFYLAGGTALSMQIGHRVSTDLDWFSAEQTLSAQQRDAIRGPLQKSEAYLAGTEQDGMIYAQLFGAEVSFIHQPHPLIEPPVDYQGVRLASVADIGLMKLAAVNSRGTRRDFVDLYCLREMVPLERVFALAAIKYPDRPDFLLIAARALAYFEDAELQPMPRMLAPVPWADVRAYCESAARRLARTLSGLD